MGNNINFVPEDYVQSNDSYRMNLIYFVLLSIVLAAFGGTFLTLKLRQRSLQEQENVINEKLSKAESAIQQFEELQAKRKDMLKTALTTSELLEPIPKTVLLAALTNNLPPGASFVKLGITQKELKQPKTKNSGRYNNAVANGNAENQMSQEQLMETHISIEGIAPSDLQVAHYIEKLGNEHLFDSVELVESKEYKVENSLYRCFRLKTMLRKGIKLTKEDIEDIRYHGVRRNISLPSKDDESNISKEL